VLRCIGAGLASVVVGGVLLVIAAGVFLTFRSNGEEAVAVSLDPEALVKSLFAWMVAMVLFASGFLAEARRSRL
jgi:ABC-type amino acid transport system permease subunit